MDLLSTFGIRTPQRCVTSDASAALAALAQLRPPLAVKLMSQVSHKSDVGGVRLGIIDETTLLDAIHEIDCAAARHAIDVKGYLVEEMASPGIEVLVGGIVDKVFGPAVLVGLGGIYTEILDDVALRICPISAKDAQDMIRELRAAPLLLGARGRPGVDIDSLASTLLALGGAEGFLMCNATEVVEVDLNPVIVSASGAIAVDARVVLGRGAKHAG